MTHKVCKRRRRLQCIPPVKLYAPYLRLPDACKHCLSGITKPDPLDCNSSFTVKESNKGTLSFFVAAGQRRGEASGHRHQNFAEAQITPAIQLEGSIEYNDERRELLDIQNDPSAIRDTIVAHFLDKRGRIAAETVRIISPYAQRRNTLQKQCIVKYCF